VKAHAWQRRKRPVVPGRWPGPDLARAKRGGLPVPGPGSRSSAWSARRGGALAAGPGPLAGRGHTV